jgi:hypothetical protein
LSRLPQKRTEPFPSRPPRVPGNVYLQVGDKVFHKKFKAWGMGIVIEARASQVPGGFHYARIQFQDGKKRVFDNSLSSTSCCYYAGITLLDRIEV